MNSALPPPPITTTQGSNGGPYVYNLPVSTGSSLQPPVTTMAGNRPQMPPPANIAIAKPVNRGSLQPAVPGAMQAQPQVLVLC